MIRVAIVDDEPLAVDRLQRLCGAMAEIVVAGTASDAREALALVELRRIDVLLLDINMPGCDGLSLARRLTTRGAEAPSVIFVTAHDDFAVAAFELAATDYLLKPVSAERLGCALSRVSARLNVAQAPALGPRDGARLEWWVPHGGELTRLASQEISLVEAERDYVRLHARGRSFLVRETMAAVERDLDPALFVRVHRSVIVRRDRIEAMRRDDGQWTLLLDDGARAPVGRSYLAGLQATLRDGRRIIPSIQPIGGR